MTAPLCKESGAVVVSIASEKATETRKSFPRFYPHTLTHSPEIPCTSAFQMVRDNVRDGEGRHCIFSFFFTLSRNFHNFAENHYIE